MNLEEVISKLEALGTEQTKKTLMRHGVNEPLFGVKIGDMKKLVKDIKKDQDLVKALFNTGNYDAMYLAGLAINPKLVTKELLEDWIEKVDCLALAEYTVANVAAESQFARELAIKWMSSDDENIATCGWSTYSNYISISHDLDLDEIAEYLNFVENVIHSQPNRVKYTMNGFVMSVGSYIEELNQRALEAANHIGKVDVYMGKTSCKVPNAKEQIEKIISMDRVGKKHKRCIC